MMYYCKKCFERHAGLCPKEVATDAVKASPLLPQQGGEQTVWFSDMHVDALAMQLAGQEHDDIHQLIWEGNPPEPWGDVWCKYKPEAERLIDLVKSTGPAAVLPQVGARKKFEMTPEILAALDKAAKTGMCYAEMSDGSIIFINRGEQPEDNADLNCPHCGGSGHKDDVRPQVGEAKPVAYVKYHDGVLVIDDNCISEGPEDTYEPCDEWRPVFAAPATLGEAKATLPEALIERLRIHAGNKDNTAFARSTMREVLENVVVEEAKAVALIDIGAIVNRFLCWKLPQTFYPDCGISFDWRKDDEWNKNKTWPVGTNLFTADEAKAMFMHCLATPVAEALPAVTQRTEAIFDTWKYRQHGDGKWLYMRDLKLGADFQGCNRNLVRDDCYDWTPLFEALPVAAERDKKLLESVTALRDRLKMCGEELAKSGDEALEAIAAHYTGISGEIDVVLQGEKA